MPAHYNAGQRGSQDSTGGNASWGTAMGTTGAPKCSSTQPRQLGAHELGERGEAKGGPILKGEEGKPVPETILTSD